MYVKEKQGATTLTDGIYYAYTDHLGSIVAITNYTGGNKTAQNFDAWGRRRDPVTWAYTTSNNMPAWSFRGYTGHEHLDEFDLINMNGRLYDPILGRMLSPDNYVQDATSTQGYNRYAYVLNNPLKYTDPSGEVLPLLAVAAIVGGVTGIINVAVSADNIEGFWEGAASFAVGFGSGFAAVATGGSSTLAQLGVAAGTSAIVAGTNNVIAQTNHFQGKVDWNSVGNSSIIGGVSGIASFGAAKGVGAVFKGDVIIGEGFRISGRSIPGMAIKQGLGGFAGGYVGGSVTGMMMYGDAEIAHQMGMKSAYFGGAFGIGMGTASAYYQAKNAGYNAWTGEQRIPKTLYHYTNSSNTNSIDVNGLQPSKDGHVYTTPEGNYSSQQAIEALNLNPNGGTRNAVYQIDVNSLIKDGVIPVRGPTPVVGGSGFEVLFNQPIPAKHLTLIR